ncbi:MAG: YihA family ribosome biogenesis GTP-binding protein [Clostridia bacterium]|nr:YihA family ribosome biogenesis GTP-binding protein [Clostridia bacterium]MBQ2319375.1 YihA family ribosome biogenesis GTP-binding protein [Clostridia bacterium]MBQ2420099.1 YihA family ribosome biogenesis GTP-binding protein [Clostridia bacterium]MBQ5598332.1 YihA family ribosome biogenesis GTP-binding protein [Clostridia bacterium]
MNYNNIYYEASYGTSKQLSKSNLPEIAFSGRSNVGKSSLMNKIFNRKSLVRVSSVPGKTVTVNFFRLDNVRFVDLPGYGYAKLPDKEKIRFADLMEHYFGSNRDIRLVVQLVDMRHNPSKDDIGMISFLKENGFDFIIALTKADKLNKTEFNKQLNSLTGIFNEMDVNVPVIPFSSVNGLGVEEVKRIIEEKVV